MRIYKEFLFEAAHFLPSAPPGHPNSRIHGHSFRARVTIDGEPDPTTGVLLHFDDIEAALAEAREALDHHFLNEVEGLEVPTLRAHRHLAVGSPAQPAVRSHRDSNLARQLP